VKRVILLVALIACGKSDKPPPSPSVDEAMCADMRHMIASSLLDMKTGYQGEMNMKIEDDTPLNPKAKSVAERLDNVSRQALAQVLQLERDIAKYYRELMPLLDAAAAAYKGKGDTVAPTKAVFDKAKEASTVPGDTARATIAKLQTETDAIAKDAKTDADRAAVKSVQDGFAGSLHTAGVVKVEVLGGQVIAEFQKKCLN
jgi:hypothetical protein